MAVSVVDANPTRPNEKIPPLHRDMPPLPRLKGKTMIKPLILSPIDIEKENYELDLFNKISEKINELVDVVNELQIKVNKLAPNIDFAQPEVKENMQDEFAEQRKWIGYLCWFWDDVYGLKTAGVLEDITTIEEEFHYAKKDTCTVWKHCEPVKPDNDIIYKGDDNE